MLRLIDTALLAGIFAGVWWSSLKPNLDIRTVLQDVRNLIGKAVKDE